MPVVKREPEAARIQKEVAEVLWPQAVAEYAKLQRIHEGFRAYYNFIRPHMALDDHTFAQAAAVPIELDTNRWLDLIRQAARQTDRES